MIRIITYSCLAFRIIALFSSAELFDIFQNLGADGNGLAVSCG